MGTSRYLVFVVVAAVWFSTCVCASGFSRHGVPGLPASRSDVSGDVDEMFLWRRSTAEAVAPAIDPALPNASFILAAKRTHRRDPLDDFKRYDGGWNVSNDHYWASVGYTAAPVFVISALWFVGFGLILMCICCYVCCCRRPSYSYSRTAYALSVILLVIFTCAAIIGCALLYHAQAKAYKSWTGTVDYAVYQANTTAENLRNFSSILSVAKSSGVSQFFMSASDQARIDEIQTRINTSTDDLTRRVDDNSDKIHDLLDDVRLALIIVAAVMLLLTFLGFLLSLLGLQFLVYILVVIGWILVTGTFILCGVFLILHNVSGDTCVAMDEWVHNPTSHTALDDILPCMDVATANASLYQSKETTFSLVNVVNQAIVNVSNRNFPPSVRPPLNFNQSGPMMPVLCNPFNSDFTDRDCRIGEVTFDNASQVWENYVCNVSSSGVCTTVGRVTPDVYTQMTSAVTVSYGLYHYTPFLVNLEDCTFVRDTFNSISQNNCPGVRKYSRHIYIGLVMVSAGVMLSLVFWVIYARERRHRKYNKQFIQN